MGLFDFTKRKRASSKQLKRKDCFEDIYSNLQRELDAQDAQLYAIREAEGLFESTGDIGSLIDFWENLWENGGLLFNGSTWAFRLADLYINLQQYDDAIRAVNMISKDLYSEKADYYINIINKLKAKAK